MKMNKILLMALLAGIATPQCSAAGFSDFFSSIFFGSEQANAEQPQAGNNENESFFDQASKPFTEFAGKFADIAEERVKQATNDKGIFGGIADAIQKLFMQQILGKITGFFDWVITTLQADLNRQGQPQDRSRQQDEADRTGSHSAASDTGF